MKKLFAVILIILITLTACSQGAGDTPTVSKKPEEKDPVKPVTSSIFGRNVKYNSYTPAENLTLPIPSGEILNAVQIEKRLYLLGDGTVHSLDIETGESAKLFDTSATLLDANGRKLYTYSAGTSTISEYDPANGAASDITLEITGVDSVERFRITDDYYIFECRIIGEVFIETYIYVYSRETCAQTISKKTSGGMDFYPYKDNKLLSVTQDEVFGTNRLSLFDAETGKIENLRDIDMDFRPAVAYCPKTDTVIAYGAPSMLAGFRNSDDSSILSSVVFVTEYSLEDKDRIVHNRYYFDVPYDAKFFVSTYENIVSAVSTADSELRVLDMLNPPESITLLDSAGIPWDVIYSFESETGIFVKNAYTDFDKLVLKLMAGDDDFDIYNTGSAFHNYVNADVYVDLKSVESLNSRISGSTAVDFMVSYNGKYFGVPGNIRNYWTKENYPENGTQFSYSLVMSENVYYTKFVDVAEKTYSDPDGEELYKLFKYINDNPGGNPKKMPFGDDVTIYSANVFMLNQKSHNSENSIRFLEYLFDCYNGDIPGIIPESDCYPRLESTENCYAEWRCRPTEIINPIFKARNTIHNQKEGLSKSELKKLARETAAEVAMRIGE